MLELHAYRRAEAGQESGGVREKKRCECVQSGGGVLGGWVGGGQANSFKKINIVYCEHCQNWSP